MITIRNEQKTDWQAAEDLTRRAFYNIYIPGCVEHYLLRQMRRHPDFIPELAFVLETDGRLAGSIYYTKATLTDENGGKKKILTFGPVCIDPEHQRKGYGKMLMEHSFQAAANLGWEAIVIFGNPSNYVTSGFRSCKRYAIATEDGKFPTAMLAKELKPRALDGHRWFYAGSPALEIDEEEALRYDDSLEKMEKKILPSQEEFFILSHSHLD